MSISSYTNDLELVENRSCVDHVVVAVSRFNPTGSYPPSLHRVIAFNVYDNVISVPNLTALESFNIALSPSMIPSTACMSIG